MSDRLNLIPRLAVLVDGGPLDPNEAHAVEEIRVEAALGLPAMAEIVLTDPELRFIDGHRPDLGAPIQLRAPSEGGDLLVFDGEVVELEPVFDHGVPRLRVRALDGLHHLGRHRQLRSFIDLTDADIADQIAREHGLSARCEAMGLLHPYLLQQNETDLALLQRRARALGWALRVWEGTLYFGPPDPSASPTLLELGRGLLEFRPRLSTLGTLRRARVRGWDPAGRTEILSEVAVGKRGAEIGEERDGAQLVSDAFQVEPEAQALGGPVRTQREADERARALADEAAERAVEAEGLAQGTASLQPGGVVELPNLGKRFSGKYQITSVIHHQGDGAFQTSFSATGTRPRLLIDLTASDPPPSLGVLSAVVTDNQDPEGLGRVQVRYPQLTPDHASPWARVASPGAGPERGLALLPEVGDEVLVALEMGDIQHPYVLGGLWNGKDPLPASDLVSGGKVVRRVLRTREGHQISLSDESGGGTVIIEDKNGNRVALDSSSNAISLHARGDIVIEAGGSLTLKAAQTLSAEATGSLEMTSKAKLTFETTGAMTLSAAQLSFG